MTLFEFQLLCEDEQVDLLYKTGVYLGKRVKGEVRILLFQLDGFYVEIMYLKYRYLIKKLHCFTSTEHLDLYLKQIDVDDLIKCFN